MNYITTLITINCLLILSSCGDSCDNSSGTKTKQNTVETVQNTHPNNVQLYSDEEIEADPRLFKFPEGDTTYIMKQYIMVFLKSGESGKQDSLKAAEIQKAHLAHINQLSDEGKIVMAGPFGDNSDFRGILLFDVATVEEALELEGKDPAVKAGRLVMDAHPWWGGVGTTLK